MVILYRPPGARTRPSRPGLLRQARRVTKPTRWQQGNISSWVRYALSQSAEDIETEGRWKTEDKDDVRRTFYVEQLYRFEEV